MLKGKCKIQFEKWYSFNVYSDTHHILGLNEFYNLPFSMQWGVYLEFFDSVGVYIDIQFYAVNNFICKVNTLDGLYYQDLYNNRQQAQQKAIEQSNEIFNCK